MSKHIPFRTCLICRTKKEKSQLIRISLDLDGNIVIGMAPEEAGGKVLNTGRGVYVCRKEQCINKITKSKSSLLNMNVLANIKAVCKA